MSQFEDDSGGGGSGEMKTGKAAIAERKKKRREGKQQKDKHSASVVVACLKRLLPVGLNVFGGRELDIVQQSKEKFLQVQLPHFPIPPYPSLIHWIPFQKENEDKIRDFIRALLDIPEKVCHLSIHLSIVCIMRL